MNWITTNIRLPEDMYKKLKLQAARERKSLSAVIREKIAGKKQVKKQEREDVKAFMKEVDRVARLIAKDNKGINLTEELIKMRYEQ